jgi:hypothetical protein
VELSVSVVVIDPLIEFPASVIVLLLVAESVSEYESPWSLSLSSSLLVSLAVQVGVSASARRSADPAYIGFELSKNIQKDRPCRSIRSVMLFQR